MPFESEASDDFEDIDEGDSDAAYESYIDDQLVELLVDNGLLLREDTKDRIRERILDASPVYLSLVTSELAKVEMLLAADRPDLAAAFFRAYRSLDGYLAGVIINPIAGILMEPIAALFVESKLKSHRRTIAKTLGINLRNALLDHICTNDEIKREIGKQLRIFDQITVDRHLIVHGFAEPTLDQVNQCRNVARTTAELIEKERAGATRVGTHSL